ncbi:MAG TPA: glycosyltransferase [Pirellulales bacterium]|nr:glycosyltransferase [Pirellulales bacterium]
MLADLAVLMPVYNAERYLAEAVESILHQTYAKFEFIIIDDGSTDRSVEILSSLAAADPRIRLVHRPNSGYLRALNEGLAMCRGTFVARMDADDVALPRRFERQIGYLLEHAECLAVGSGILRIDADGDLLCEEPMPRTHEEIEVRLLQGLGALPHPGAMIRRSALAEIGGYREPYYGAEDFDLWLRLAERGRLANLPEPLIKCRVHPQNFTFIHEMRGRAAAAAALADAYRRRGQPRPIDLPDALSPALRGADRERAWTRSAIYAGQYRTARKHAWSICRRKFWQADSWILLAHALLGPRAEPIRRLYRRMRGRGT